MAKELVVYFSVYGTAKIVAEEIAKQTGADIAEIELPHSAATTTRDSWFVYVIRVKDAERRDEVSAKLKALGIPVRPYFSPIHLQPYMQEKFGYEPGRFPVTEDLGRRGLAIPFSGKMTREQVRQVGSALRQIF